MAIKSVKKRNWAFVLYPESAPADWLDILNKTGLQGAVSPLHDKDINADGEPKKSHYHVILCYPGPTTYNVVNSLVSSLNAPSPQPLESVRGYYRYLCHLDNPEKVQYDELYITTFGGFNYRDYIELTKSEVNAIISRIQLLIRKYELIEYADLLDVLLDNDWQDMYDVAITHTLLFNSYLRSRRYKHDFKGADEIEQCLAGDCSDSE